LPAPLSALGAALSYPRRESLEILFWELLDNPLKFFDSAHGANLIKQDSGDKQQNCPVKLRTAGMSVSAWLTERRQTKRKTD